MDDSDETMAPDLRPNLAKDTGVEQVGILVENGSAVPLMMIWRMPS